MIEQKIIDLLVDKFKEDDFNDYFLVEVKLSTQNKLEVYIDCDTGLTLAKCQKISRYLESYLDEEQWLGDRYVIEVSSPGVSRPLILYRQYQKNKGRKLEIHFLEEGKKKKEGILVDANENACFLEEKIVLREGKKKKRTTTILEIPYSIIKKAIIKPSFK